MTTPRFPRGHDPLIRPNRLVSAGQVRQVLGPQLAEHVNVLECHVGRVYLEAPASLVPHLRDMQKFFHLKLAERGLTCFAIHIRPRLDP